MAELPFNPVRESLYTTDELLEGFDSSNRQSYASTMDFRVYCHALSSGRDLPSVSMAMTRASHDNCIKRSALSFLTRRPKIVSVMGGHRVARNSTTYRSIVELTRELARNGFTLVSGGGPGATWRINR